MIAPGENNNREIEELLAAQADALLAGQTLTPQGPDAAALFQLAERLYRHLTPVEPSGAFLSRVKQELVAEAHPSPARVRQINLLARWRQLPTGYRVVASLGGLTLTAALTLLAAHRALQSRQHQPKPEPGLSLNTVS